METNYLIIGLIVLVAVCIILLLIWKNRKDKKAYEKETSLSEIKPAQHKEEKT